MTRLDETRTFIPVSIAILTVSDTRTAETDRSGDTLAERIAEAGHWLADRAICADDIAAIRGHVRTWTADPSTDVVITTGGTGFGPRDHVPEAMSEGVEREAPGIPEAARAHGQDRTPFSMLSRARAGIRGDTLIVNLPGSRGGVSDSLDALFPGLIHAFKMLRGDAHEHDPRPEGTS